MSTKVKHPIMTNNSDKVFSSDELPKKNSCEQKYEAFLLQQNSKAILHFIDSIKPAYLFSARHDIKQNNVYSLDLVSVDSHHDLPGEIGALSSADSLELNLNTPVKTICRITNQSRQLNPSVLFYSQFQNQLFGEYVPNGKAIYGELFGPMDENGICVPIAISIKLLRVGFLEIVNKHFPTVHHQHWKQARINKFVTDNF